MRNHDISEFQILGVGGVKSRDSSSQESRSDEMRKSRKSWNKHINRSFRYQELEESRVETLHHRSPEVAKCGTSKFWNRHINKDSILEFRIPGVGGVKSRDSSSQESWSCEMQNAEIPFCCRQWLPLMVTWEGGANTKLSSISRFFIIGMSKCEIAKSLYG